MAYPQEHHAAGCQGVPHHPAEAWGGTAPCHGAETGCQDPLAQHQARSQGLLAFLLEQVHRLAVACQG